MQYTKRFLLNSSGVSIAYSIKWKSFPGDDGKYYESEEVKYLQLSFVKKIFSSHKNTNYRGFTLLGIHIGIGHMNQTEKII